MLEVEKTYNCPECRQEAMKATAAKKAAFTTNGPSAQEDCPLCKGLGSVTVRQIADFYMIEAD